MSQGKIEIRTSNRGGRRPGAGRPRGKRDRAVREALAEAGRSGELPLAYMLAVMRDGREDPKRQDAMAIAAAPYCHPRLSAVDSKSRLDLTALSDEQLEALRRFLLAIGDTQQPAMPALDGSTKLQ